MTLFFFCGPHLNKKNVLQTQHMWHTSGRITLYISPLFILNAGKSCCSAVTCLDSHIYTIIHFTVVCNIICNHYFATMIIPTANLKVTVRPSHTIWLNHNASGYALSPHHVPLMQVNVTSGGRYEASGRHRYGLLSTHHALPVLVLLRHCY